MCSRTSHLQGGFSLYDMCFADGMSFDAGTWDEKITDSLNYLFLLKAIVKEGQTNQQN